MVHIKMRNFLEFLIEEFLLIELFTAIFKLIKLIFNFFILFHPDPSSLTE